MLKSRHVLKRCFSIAQSQERMIPCFIAGKNIETGSFAEATSPYTKGVIGQVAQADAAVVKQASEAAASAQKTWAGVSLDEKIDVMKAWGVEIAKRQDELMESLIVEGGSAGFKAGLEFGFAQNICNDLGDIMKPHINEVRSEKNTGLGLGKVAEYYVVRKPVGVIGMICPFNFPVVLTMRSAVNALLCGNGFVFKPSPHTTISGNILAETAEKVLPSGLVNCIHGGAETAIAMCDEPLLNRMIFIGSSAIGREIGMRCAGNFKQFVLECGGKSPLIVCDDADVGNAIGNIVPGFTMHSGQVCIASTRILCHESLAEPIKGAVSGALGTLDWAKSDGSGFLNPLIVPGSVDRCKRMVQDAVDKGAEIVCQKDLPAELGETGNYYPPTLLTNVTPDMDIYDEEAFGPVSYIQTFSTDQEAIELANSSKYGLAAGVHSVDLHRAQDIASQIESGGINVNGGTFTDNSVAPFGGVKFSGIGRQNNREEVEFMMESSTIYMYPDGRKMA